MAKASKTTIIAPLFERRTAGLYHNSLAALGPDGDIMGLYRKMHIPDDPGFHEKFYFTPGDLGFKRFDTPVGPVGALICWDQWYPEAARLTALKRGASRSSTPRPSAGTPRKRPSYGQEQRDAWITIQRSHAIANGCFVASVNRVGHEVSPAGRRRHRVLGVELRVRPHGHGAGPGVHGQGGDPPGPEIDPTLVEKTRTHWPFLRDRSIDAYGPLDKRKTAASSTTRTRHLQRIRGHRPPACRRLFP